MPHFFNFIYHLATLKSQCWALLLYLKIFHNKLYKIWFNINILLRCQRGGAHNITPVRVTINTKIRTPNNRISSLTAHIIATWDEMEWHKSIENITGLVDKCGGGSDTRWYSFAFDCWRCCYSPFPISFHNIILLLLHFLFFYISLFILTPSNKYISVKFFPSLGEDILDIRIHRDRSIYSYAIVHIAFRPQVFAFAIYVI